MDRRPVDHVGAHAFGFFDQRRARIARPNKAGVDFDAGAARLDPRALEHRPTLCLLFLQARLQRQLARHRQDEDRVHDAVFADQLGRPRQRGGADVVAEDRHQRRAVTDRRSQCSVRRAI
jgi:hypothetical protein